MVLDHGGACSERKIDQAADSWHACTHTTGITSEMTATTTTDSSVCPRAQAHTVRHASVNEEHIDAAHMHGHAGMQSGAQQPAGHAPTQRTPAACTLQMGATQMRATHCTPNALCADSISIESSHERLPPCNRHNAGEQREGHAGGQAAGERARLISCLAAQATGAS